MSSEVARAREMLRDLPRLLENPLEEMPEDCEEQAAESPEEQLFFPMESYSCSEDDLFELTGPPEFRKTVEEEFPFMFLSHPKKKSPWESFKVTKFDDEGKIKRKFLRSHNPPKELREEPLISIIDTDPEEIEWKLFCEDLDFIESRPRRPLAGLRVE